MTEGNTSIKYDLCIIGSGPAGIITALEYCRSNPDKRVLLLEYGFKNLGPENDLDDSITIKNPVNHHYPYECTNKGLGGTSASWGGRCVNYDEVDFVKRDAIGENCTWDKALFDDIDQYTDKAAAYFECGRALFDLNKIQAKSATRIAEGFIQGDITDSIVERWSMPTRFGSRYADELNALTNLTYFEGKEARSFSEPDEHGKVSTLYINDLKTKATETIQANIFVLAAGAMETTRLLLRNLQLFNALPEPPKALGKYYQNHLSGKIASIKFYGDPKKTDYGFQMDDGGVYVRRRFQFSADFLVKNNLLNTAMWLDNPLYYNPQHGSGPMSFMYLAMITPVLGKKLAPPAVALSVTGGKVFGISKHLLNIVKGLPGSLLKPASIFYRRYCLKRKLPGVFLYNPENRYALHFHAEQIPYEGNRMELGPDGERLIVHYDLTDVDISSVITLHQELDEWLRKCNCGELEYWYPEEERAKMIRQISKDGVHQLGTTRIADSADKGVVDRDVKLFGTNNIYVCSSSVFPTSGQANPTFFLGAFAVRLASHLSKIT
ncbi:GMC family oxidoreductase [Mucilaginibacter calamicampi]|uniref:GMC family oxidoreductase n=1 Tax=Mucilaginibacter calamicampi TaxID=1302352 RepID=A0ABW2Z103_9SPHI